jgi:calcineurin-like phosphoesterase family protein
MSKTFIGSDWHWSHRKIMEFCPKTRGQFHDVDHMNSEMIRMWNEEVSPEDTVYMVGDIAFCNASTAAGILKQLFGKKILIRGNHDIANLKSEEFCACFDEIHSDLIMTHNKIPVHINHFPLLGWNRAHYGGVHFYGHLHNNESGLEKYRARNVGFDYTGKIVSNFDDMIQDALTGEIKSHH